MIIFISIFLTIIITIFYSLFELKEIEKKEIIKFKTKKWLWYNIKYNGLFLLLSLIVFILTIIQHNTIGFFLTLFGFLFYFFIHKPFLEKNIEIEEDFKFIKKKNKKEIIKDFKTILIRSLLLYFVFGILYYLFPTNIEFHYLLFIPFITSISFTDGKYGLIDDIQLILFLIIIGFIYYINDFDLFFLPFSFFIFGFFIFLFEFLAIKIFNKIKGEEREALLGGMDLITLYILFLAGGFHFLQTIIFGLTLLIVLYKMIKKKEDNIFYLFQFLHYAFIIYLISISFFKI